jgi:tRNA (cytidine/uridine-2'-O-)-methyltransferase
LPFAHTPLTMSGKIVTESASAHRPAMFHIVLFQPEIPPNTGNIVRLSANTGCHLHLIKPLGFSLAEPALKRAGMDYAEFAQVKQYDNWRECRAALPDARWFAFTTKGNIRHDAPAYRAGDAFVFGPESRGLPAEILNELGADRLLRIPMIEGNRSVNLSNTVAVAVYEAWRQIGFAGAD